jgi:RNase H-fold protein (predicted Holliday junction resolvase)
MRGNRGEQAVETERFAEELRAVLDVPVESFDERFTTDLAERAVDAAAPADARAAAYLLSSYLEWSTSKSS